MTNPSKYMKHLPFCNIMQDWSEAEQALADTPEQFKDEGWQVAYDEMRRKQRTCTCGMEVARQQFVDVADSIKYC